MHPGRGVDVFQSVRPTQVRVVCFDTEWTLYPDSAYDWLGLLAADLEHLTGILPGGVCSDQCEDMLRLALSYDDRDDRWTYAARVALGRAGGRDWWWVRNLARRCIQGWPYINGRLLLSGVNAKTLGFPEWLDAAYMLLWSAQEGKDQVLFDLELNRMPAGVAVRREFSQIRAMGEAFAAD